MKISKLYLHSFRGIPNELNIDFTHMGKAVSTIIYGDNGSGKSTIVDALEFNIQGRICRTTVINNLNYASPLSYKYHPLVGATTIVTFDDGSTNSRGIDVTYTKKGVELRSDNKLLHNGFSLAPIVLRRNDIISYNNMPREKRQILFLSFLYSQFIKIDEVEKNALHWENDPYIIKLKDNYVELKQYRRNKVKELAELCRVKSNKVPFSTNEKVFAFINQYLFPKGNKKKKQKTSNSLFTPLQRKIQSLGREIVHLNDEINEVTKETEKLLNPVNYGILIGERREANAEFINKASEFLSEAFKVVSNVEYVEDLRLDIGNTTSASFEVLVKLKNGKSIAPNRIFSEGNYDLLVLLLYVSLIRACVTEGQQPVLILDDTLQSIDSTVQNKFMHYIIKTCKDWQLIVTCHDELWLNQLKFIFNTFGHPFKELRTHAWCFEEGPKIEYVSKTGEDKSLLQAIETGNKSIIAAQAGVFLERICQKLSVSLGISVHRVEGDRYTIGDLWPGIIKQMKKTVLSELLESINCELQVRNMLGCHANDWALAMSEKEVFSFATNVETLYKKVFCIHCNTWITNKTCSGNIIAECKCRGLYYDRKQSL